MSRLLRPFAVLIAVALMTAGFGPTALAHTRSESHTAWQIDGRHIETTVAIPELEVKRLAPQGGTVTNDEVAKYMAGKVTASADGKACANPGGAKALASTAQFRRVQFVFDCASDKNLKLGFDAFYELVPSHVDFAQIQVTGKDFVEQVRKTGEGAHPKIPTDRDFASR